MGKGSSGIQNSRTGANELYSLRSGARGAKTAYGFEYIGEGASFDTAANVARINEIRKEDGSRAVIRENLENIRAGQQVSTYDLDNSADRGSYISTADNLVVWTKNSDGTWRGSNGQTRETSSMVREIYNSNVSLSPGRITTESHENVMGKHRTYAGMSYQEGTFDSLMNKDGRPMKYEHSGLVTTYNGKKYGVIKSTSGQSGKSYYSVIHMGTGLGIGSSTSSYKEVAAQIKELDAKIDEFKGLRGAEERFARTIRGD